MPDPNEVGALWKKENDRGVYYSGTIDTDRLLELSGGVTGKISLMAYPVLDKANPNQPDLRLKFYGGKAKRTAPLPPPREDEIPF